MYIYINKMCKDAYLCAKYTHFNYLLKDIINPNIE